MFWLGNIFLCVLVFTIKVIDHLLGFCWRWTCRYMIISSHTWTKCLIATLAWSPNALLPCTIYFTWLMVMLWLCPPLLTHGPHQTV
jgi:hypothetical protein